MLWDWGQNSSLDSDLGSTDKQRLSLCFCLCVKGWVCDLNPLNPVSLLSCKSSSNLPDTSFLYRGLALQCHIIITVFFLYNMFWGTVIAARQQPDNRCPWSQHSICLSGGIIWEVGRDSGDWNTASKAPHQHGLSLTTNLCLPSVRMGMVKKFSLCVSRPLASSGLKAHFELCVRLLALHTLIPDVRPEDVLEFPFKKWQCCG